MNGTTMNKIKTILNFLEKRYGKYIDRSHSSNQEIFELLIGTILSQRTRDENTSRAAERLFKVARTPKQIIKLPMRKLQALIRISGPYKQKAKKIKRTSKTISEKFNGKVPHTREELMKLYGVGYKTADIVLMYGFNIPSIAIDTHANRVPKRIGLVDKNANVEKVKEVLEGIFPRNKWYLINLGFVNFGKEICKPIKPLCIKDKKNCPFSGFCRAYRTKDYTV
jgi:endonuclease-3